LTELRVKKRKEARKRGDDGSLKSARKGVRQTKAPAVSAICTRKQPFSADRETAGKEDTRKDISVKGNSPG